MISIIDEPYGQTPVGQRLMVVAQSDQYFQNGFKYVFRIPELDADFYIQPNPQGVGMLDLAPIIRDTLKHVKLANQVGVAAESESVFCTEFITCREGWLVDGVFTLSGEKPAKTDSMCFWLANYEVTDGYKPDPSVRYNVCDTNNYLLSERYHDTHVWQYAAQHLTNASQDVFVPTQDVSWGIMYTHEFDSVLNSCATHIKVRVYDAADSLVSSELLLLSADGGKYVDAFGIYPENLREYGLDMTDWLYYRFQAVSAEGESLSRSYVFYRVDTPCDTPTIRLQWANTVGGVDYFDFTRKSELTYDYERKRYQKVIGTYGDYSFNFNTYDRGVTERPVIATKGLQINSNWITAGEFTLLQTLILSNDVYIVQTDGSQIPVVVEDTSYICRDERAGRLWNLSLKLRYSQAVGL
jgi:hypothetical protein